MSACPCGCGRNLGHVRYVLARRWVEIQCTIPLFVRWAEVMDAAGKDAAETRRVLNGTLANSREIADAWLAEAHGEGAPYSATAMKRAMKKWQTMALTVMKSMKVLDPVFTQQWWATKPWSKQPSVIPSNDNARSVSDILGVNPTGRGFLR